MVNYIASDTNSDLSPSWTDTTIFDKEMVDDGSETTGSSSDSIADGVTRSAGYISEAGNPNNDAFEDGSTQTVELNVTTGSMDLTGRMRIVKLSSTGTVLQSGTFGGFKTLNPAVVVLDCLAPTWSSTEACSNRVAFELSFNNANGMGMAATLGISFGTTDNEIATTITKDTSGCVVAGVVLARPINTSAMI